MPRPMKKSEVRQTGLTMYTNMLACYGFKNSMAVYKNLRKRLKIERKRRKTIRKKEKN